jgi:hypothetical protein
MKRSSRWAIAGVVLAVWVGCSKQDAAPAAPAADASALSNDARGPSAPGPDTTLPKPIAATIDGHPVTFTHGVGTWVNELWLRIVLSTTPSTCDERAPPSATRIELEIGSGPAQKFFAGESVPVDVHVFSPSNHESWMPGGALAMTSVGRDVGDAVVGTLRFEGVGKDRPNFAATGDFRVPLCRHAPPLPNLPSTVADQEVQGVVRRVPQVFRSIVATIRHDKDLDRDALDQIIFYPDAGVDCTPAIRESVAISVRGVSTTSPILGRPLPIDASHTIATADGGRPRFNGIGDVGWIEFSKLGFATGETIRGDLALDAPKTGGGEPGDHLEGHFVARVCRLTP